MSGIKITDEQEKINKKKKEENWVALIWCPIFGLALSVNALNGKYGLLDWQEWLLVGGAIACVAGAVFAFIQLLFGPHKEKAEKVAGKVIGYGLFVPFLVALAIVGIVVAFGLVSGWLKGTPWWAAVIIVLLVFVLIGLRDIVDRQR